jgi:hypothetical protein
MFRLSSSHCGGSSASPIAIPVSGAAADPHHTPKCLPLTVHAGGLKGQRRLVRAGEKELLVKSSGGGLDCPQAQRCLWLHLLLS